MQYPNFNEEKKLWRKGYKWVVGLDESGRGPLAGPVIAAAVVIKISNFPGRLRADSPKGCFPISNKFSIFNFQKLKCVRDSKQLTPKKREEFFDILTNHPKIEWGIGRVSEKIIDKINILEATKLAMIKAVKNLEKKLTHKTSDRLFCESGRETGRKIDFLILDGNFGINLPFSQKSIIKGDEKVFSCAAASILAKVYRDRIMKKYHKKHPQYGFDRHKGYPTKHHKKMIKKYGLCSLHRESFNYH